MYTKNNNHNIVLYDVDDTLVAIDPIEGVEPLVIENGPYKEVVYPIHQEIKRLKQAKMRGHYVRVHSQGGSDWAETVVKALELENYVDSIETKPKWYHDDLPADSWMSRFYEGPKR